MLKMGVFESDTWIKCGRCAKYIKKGVSILMPEGFGKVCSPCFENDRKIAHMVTK